MVMIPVLVILQEYRLHEYLNNIKIYSEIYSNQINSHLLFKNINVGASRNKNKT